MSTREFPNFQTLVSNRKLQKEAEQVFKKIHEGMERFDDCWDRIHDTTNATQREKFENELKKEIKKLQRLREQVKSWASNNEFKDKRVLLDYRRQIESYMEKYKSLERKSKRGRSNVNSKKKKKKKKILPRNYAHKKKWMESKVGEIESIMNRMNETLERLNDSRRPDQEEVQRCEDLLEFGTYYKKGLDLTIRLLEEYRILPNEVEEIEDDITFFVEEYDSPDYLHADDLFEKFKGKENGPVVLEKKASVEVKKARKEAKKKADSQKARKKSHSSTSEPKLMFNRPRAPSDKRQEKKKKKPKSAGSETLLRFNTRTPTPTTDKSTPSSSQKKKKKRGGSDRNPELIFNLGRSSSTGGGGGSSSSSKKKSKNEKKERKRGSKKEKVSNSGSSRSKSSSQSSSKHNRSSKKNSESGKSTLSSSSTSSSSSHRGGKRGGGDRERGGSNSDSLDRDSNDMRIGGGGSNDYPYEQVYSNYQSTRDRRKSNNSDSQGYEVYKYRSGDSSRYGNHNNNNNSSNSSSNNNSNDHQEYYHYETYEKWGNSSNRQSSSSKRRTSPNSMRSRHQDSEYQPFESSKRNRGGGSGGGSGGSRSSSSSSHHHHQMNDSGNISSQAMDDYHYKNTKERSRRSSTSSTSSDRSNTSSSPSTGGGGGGKTTSISYKEAVKRPLPKDKEDEKMLDSRYIPSGGGKVTHANTGMATGRMVMLEGGLGSQDMVVEPGQLPREGQLPPGSHLMDTNPDTSPQDLTSVFNEASLFRINQQQRRNLPPNMHELQQHQLPPRPQEQQQQQNNKNNLLSNNNNHHSSSGSSSTLPPSNHLAGVPSLVNNMGGQGLGGGGGVIEEELKNLGLPVELLDMNPPSQVTHEEQQILNILRRAYQTKPGVLDSDISYKIYTPMRLEKNVPSCFPQKYDPIFNNPKTYAKFDPETLFFAFYYQRGTYNQYLAAKELKRQSWRFHKKYLTWFQRYEQPRETTNKFELGNYVYFDYDYHGWCQRIKKGFRFKYDFLENELQ